MCVSGRVIEISSPVRFALRPAFVYGCPMAISLLIYPYVIRVGSSIMIHKIEVENFMSLKKATIDFEPLTIFIGANGSGKSAIFFGLISKIPISRRA